VQVAAPPILKEVGGIHPPFCRPYIASRHYLGLTTPRLRNLAAPGTARWPTSRSTWRCATTFRRYAQQVIRTQRRGHHPVRGHDGTSMAAVRWGVPLMVVPGAGRVRCSLTS